MTDAAVERIARWLHNKGRDWEPTGVIGPWSSMSETAKARYRYVVRALVYDPPPDLVKAFAEKETSNA